MDAEYLASAPRILSKETGRPIEECRAVLIAHGWLYGSALKSIRATQSEDKKIMTMEDKIELILLNSILDDRFYCNQLRHETLGKLLVRQRVLLDEFVKQYELPNSNNGPVMEP